MQNSHFRSHGRYKIRERQHGQKKKCQDRILYYNRSSRINVSARCPDRMYHRDESHRRPSNGVQHPELLARSLPLSNAHHMPFICCDPPKRAQYILECRTKHPLPPSSRRDPILRLEAGASRQDASKEEAGRARAQT